MLGNSMKCKACLVLAVASASAFVPMSFSRWETRKPRLSLHGGPDMVHKNLPSKLLVAPEQAIQCSTHGGKMHFNNFLGLQVFLLIVLNAVLFLLDHFTTLSLQNLYLNHRNPAFYQLVTSAFCHANVAHLSGNMFPLLIFGKLVEEELGGVGLLLCYIVCAILSNWASILFLPAHTLGLGASGVVFGLFIVAIGIRVSIRNFSWRSTVEAVIFGQFVWEKLKMEVAITAQGGIAGVNHAAHLGGAAAGLVIVLAIRLMVGLLEKSESSPKLR